MGRKIVTCGISLFFAAQVVFMMGCNQVNRKHFSCLDASKVEDGYQYFQYQASTGAKGITCAPNSKNCKITRIRKPIWPVDDATAEQVRMQWLKKSLADAGYQNSDYEIVAREPVLGMSKYDLFYDLRVRTSR